MNLMETGEPNDELVRPTAIPRETGHRVLGALELVAVADEDQAIRRLVWGRPWEVNDLTCCSTVTAEKAVV